MRNIPTKIGWIEYFIISVIFLTILIDSFLEKDWIGIVIGLFVFLFINMTLFGIRYKTDNEFLYIYSFFRLYKKVEIRRIYKIEKTWNLISSPAPSLSGRVEIYWSGYNSVVISPKYFDKFSSDILKINPSIEIK
jgi:hypothetical protein